MRNIVTGGAGFIGSHIAEYLVKQGEEVIIIDDLSGGTTDNFQGWWNYRLCTFVKADISDFHMMQSVFEDVDCVFHDACSKCVVCEKDPHRDLEVNAWGTRNVIEASLKWGVKKIVHASTGSVNNYNPKSFYGVSKTAAEGYYKAYSAMYPELNYTILRYHHVFGERQSDVGVVPTFIKRALAEKPLTIYGGYQKRRFTYVGDVVRANMIARDLPSSQILPVLSDTNRTIEDLSLDIAFLSPKSVTFEYQDHKPNEIMEFPVDNSEMKALGLVYSDYGESLENTLRWYERQNNCKCPCGDCDGICEFIG